MIIDALKRLFGAEPEGVSCQEALRFMHEYLDGELEDVRADQVEEHFRKCEACFPHLNLERSFRERLRRACERDRCPEDVRASVLDAIVREG